MLDWVVVGGGIHGVHLAVRLLKDAGVPRDRLRIVDPGAHLLDSWRRCSTNVDMAFLRSPGVHHLDANPFSLLQFAGVRSKKTQTPRGMFRQPYRRPSRKLFKEHCDSVLRAYDLPALHVRNRVVDLDLTCEHAEVRLADGDSLFARNVLLAIGASEQPRWPDWGTSLRDAGAHIEHIFTPGFHLKPKDWLGRVAVVGGGITAAQVAIRLSQGDRREVHVVSPHAPLKEIFDSDPGWIGPRFMRRFSATPDLTDRRNAITAARHVGTIPPDVHRTLRKAVERGAIIWHEGSIEARKLDHGVGFVVGEETLTVDSILLATGFEAKRPGGALLDGVIEKHSLPCAGCGYPIVDTHLRWHPRVFVTGPLAELEVGPIARNIVGARQAAERIVPFARVARA